MKLDLAFLLVDLGESWYKTAASEMIRSARRAFSQHDMRVVQITDNRRIIHPDVDGGFEADVDCIPEQLAQFRGHMFAEFALQADRPVIFCDVELLWESDKLCQRLEDISVMCLNRYKVPFFDTSIMTTGGNQREFWEFYRKTIADLPAPLYAKGADHFAMLATSRQFNSKIWEIGWKDAGAAGFKGDRQGMIQKARELDKGEAFEFVRPTASVSQGSAVDKAALRALEQRQGWAF